MGVGSGNNGNLESILKSIPDCKSVFDVGCPDRIAVLVKRRGVQRKNPVNVENESPDAF
jgi:hypothetical protein